MDLLELKKARERGEDIARHSVLIYGDPKTGKTQLAGTAAKIPQINRIYFISMENGHDTLLTMGLTDYEMAKIILIRIIDLREEPRAIETMLRLLSSRNDIVICNNHGIVNCNSCRTKEGFQGLSFNITKCRRDDIIILDTASQLGDSAVNLAVLGKEVTYKLQHDDWGQAGKYLSDCMQTIQQAVHTNFVVLAHQIVIEEDINGVKRDKIYPRIGTRNFSMGAAKYFSTVVYMEKKLGKIVAGSSVGYKPDTITGSRFNVAIEKEKELSMAAILKHSGIFNRIVEAKNGDTPVEIQEKHNTKNDISFTEVLKEAPVSVQSNKKPTLAEIMQVKLKQAK